MRRGRPLGVAPDGAVGGARGAVGVPVDGGRTAAGYPVVVIDNDLYYDDFGISADQWAREPPATAYVGKRFNRVAGVWEPESLAGDAEPG
jgi:hypothetical protein